MKCLIINNKVVIGQSYHLVNVIILALPQSDHIKRLPLYLLLTRNLRQINSWTRLEQLSFFCHLNRHQFFQMLVVVSVKPTSSHRFARMVWRRMSIGLRNRCFGGNDDALDFSVALFQNFEITDQFVTKYSHARYRFSSGGFAVFKRHYAMFVVRDLDVFDDAFIFFLFVVVIRVARQKANLNDKGLVKLVIAAVNQRPWLKFVS